MTEQTRDEIMARLREMSAQPGDPSTVGARQCRCEEYAAREQAARPVLDAARAVDTAWSEGRFQVGPHGTQALARLRAALGSAEAGAACTAAAFDGSGCRGTVVDGQCSEQDDHHPTAGMLPYDGPGAEAGAPAAEPAPDGWCCWPCARLARAAEPASDVQAARVRVAADMVRKALAYRLGVTGLCRLDTAADIGWLVETGRQIVTALDAAGVGAPEPAQDDEAQR